MRIRGFGFVALLLVCLVSCNKLRNLEYTISKPYCKDIVDSKAVAMSSTVPVKSGLSENGNALCVLDDAGNISPLIFNFDIETDNDQLRESFNAWVQESMKLECSAMAMFTGDFLLLEQVRVIGGWAILGSSGEDELSQTLAEAKGEAMSMVDHKNLLVDLGDGAVFDLAELGGMSFPSAQQLKDGYGVCRASDGRSWYYLIYNVIRRMHRSGDRLVVSDVNHSFLEVHDFIVDRDNNICALSSRDWTDDAILFFNDGSLDEWPQSRLLQFPNEQTFSYDNQWFSLTNDAFDASGSYRESPTLLSKVWVEGKELKFKQIWSGDDGSLSKYLVLPVSEEEYHIIGGSGRLKVNIRTDAAVYERFPSVFPEHFSGYVWMADNGWGLIPRDEDVNGVIERVGVDAYNIYTMEHFYIPVPDGAGNIRGCEQGKDVVYVESSRWNELQGKWDVWISKIDIRNQQVTALAEGMSEICIL